MKELHWDIETLEEVQETIASYSTGTNALHTLKTVEPYFSAVWNGVKTAELRDSSDREFKVGDILVLRQWVDLPPVGDRGWGLYGIVCGITHILKPHEISNLFGKVKTVTDGYRDIPAPEISMLSFQVLDQFKLRDIGIDLEFPHE